MEREGVEYVVQMCRTTGLECIYCTVGPCESRHCERRSHPWHGDPRVDADKLGMVPDEETRGGATPQEFSRGVFSAAQGFTNYGRFV